MIRLIRGGAAGLVLAAGVLIGSTADAATPVSGPRQPWVLLGVAAATASRWCSPERFVDSGVSYGATANGKKTSKQNPGYRLFILKKGTIFFNTQKIDAAQNNNSTPPTTDNATDLLVHVRDD